MTGKKLFSSLIQSQTFRVWIRDSLSTSKPHQKRNSQKMRSDNYAGMKNLKRWYRGGSM